MAGAADKVGMTDEAIIAAARRQGLDRAIASMPAEVVAAARRAQEQAEAIAGTALPREQAP